MKKRTLIKTRVNGKTAYGLAAPTTKAAVTLDGLVSRVERAHRKFNNSVLNAPVEVLTPLAVMAKAATIKEDSCLIYQVVLQSGAVVFIAAPRVTTREAILTAAQRCVKQEDGELKSIQQLGYAYIARPDEVRVAA